ncbi:MAG: hypothetical protein EON98_00335 [Chitinophagaceae bacterium]|nr:MAG: hypothetical protein EON98_00335 [Chitinophagaceae bacterium]
MRKKKAINRTDKKGQKGYTPITNKILQSTEITFEAIGLLAYLLSHSENFRVTKEGVINNLKGRSTEGRVKKAWTLLVEKGYLQMERIFDGNLNRSYWLVFEEPELQNTQFRDPQNQESRNQHAIEKNKEEKIKEEKKIDNSKDQIQKGKQTNSGVDASSYWKSKYDEAAFAIGNGTPFGVDVFNYLDLNNLEAMREIIGEEAFLNVEADLNKMVLASKQLGYR